MTAERISKFLERQIAVQKAGCWLGSVFSLLGGCIVVFLTFWLAYLMAFLADEGFNEVIYLVAGHKWHINHLGRLIISGAFVVLLFVAWARSNAWEMANYRRIHKNEALNEFADSQGVGAFAPILSNPQTSANLIAQALYFGPHLIFGSWNLVRQIQRLSAIDRTACASALELLMTRTGWVSAGEFAAERPDLNWHEVRAGLAEISGVLMSDDGLQLTDEFRQELSSLAVGNR